MKLIHFEKALKVAEELGYIVDKSEDFEDIYDDVLEHLWNVFDPIVLDDSNIVDSSAENVTFVLPSGQQMTRSGEFDYDEERAIYIHRVQDLDGIVYSVEWEAKPMYNAEISYWINGEQMRETFFGDAKQCGAWIYNSADNLPEGATDIKESILRAERNEDKSFKTI